MELYKKQWNGKKLATLLKLSVLLFILYILVRAYLTPQDATIYTPNSFDTLSSGWTQLVEGDGVPLDDIHQFIPIETGVPIVVERTITADMANQCVLFYAEHQEVIASVDGAVIYQLDCTGDATIFETPGRVWVSIPITEDMVGMTLQLSLVSHFYAYQGLPSTIYCVEEGGIYMVQVYFLLLRNAAALLMLTLAAISYLHACLWKPQKLRRFLFLSADFYLAVGLWLCAEANILSIWFGRVLLSSVMAMVLLRIIPVTFCHFFVALLPYSSWRTRLATVLVWGNLLGSLLLQFFFGISMFHMVFFNMLVIIGCSIFGIVELGYYHRSGTQFLTYQHACYSAILLFSASLAECVIYLHYQSYGHLMGVPLSLACLLYYIITYISLTSTQSDTATEKRRLEQALSNLDRRPLNQQINAHFLYNSLNTISAYCKEDAEQAYEAIRLLGQYMRAYTQLIAADDYVVLEEELDLMQSYMAIQNMRFENSIGFHICNHCEEVLLPPLTLQSLVENAVNHGIRKGSGGGCISITACTKYNMAEIVVADDGIGFDVKMLKASQGVGLRNLERRIQAMGGNMTIQSAKGKGTQVTLVLPLEHTILEEDEFEHTIRRR